MSRFKRLKQEKIKNTLKAISCVLALALLIGSVQDLGTYALFTDTEDIASNLAISTGDVDVEVYVAKNSDEDQDQDVVSESGFQGDMIQYGNEKSKKFIISNKGTLNQKLKLKLTTNSTLDNNVLSKITYTLKLEHPTQSTTILNGLKFGDIKSNGAEFDLDYILEPGQEISCTATISVGNLSGQINGMKDIDFDLNILATQLGYENNKGFTDIYKQHNTITIGNYTGGELITYFTGRDKKEIGILIPLNTIKIISIYSGEGEFEEKNIGTELSAFLGTNIFKKDNTSFKVGENGIGNTFSEKQKLFVQVRRNLFEIEYWEIYFRYVKGDLQAYYIVVDPPTKEVEVSIGEMEVPSEEVVEPSIEEIEVPSEEVVQPSTEEMEAPGEEVLESSTEEIEVPSEEVVEPSTEEMEDPSQEIVEASTEEIEAPSEIEVVMPSKEETEIE